jgi:hypothetical protein
MRSERPVAVTVAAQHAGHVTERGTRSKSGGCRNDGWCDALNKETTNEGLESLAHGVSRNKQNGFLDDIV